MSNTNIKWVYTGPDLRLDLDDMSVPETKFTSEFAPSKEMDEQFYRAAVRQGLLKQIPA